MRPVVGFVTLLMLVGGCSAEEPGLTTDARPDTATTRVPPEAALDDPDPLVRYQATYEMVGDDEVPTPELVEMLGDALAAELATPSQGDSGSWFTFSETLARGYATGMASRGAESVPEIRKRLQGTAGPARDWYLLALGYAGDESVAPDLISLLDSSSAAVQVQAIDLVGGFGYEGAVPVLRDLLGHPLCVENPHLPGSDCRYPVRDEAAAALRKLGYTVYTDPAGEGTYRVIES